MAAPTSTYQQALTDLQAFEWILGVVDTREENNVIQIRVASDVETPWRPVSTLAQEIYAIGLRLLNCAEINIERPEALQLMPKLANRIVKLDPKLKGTSPLTLWQSQFPPQKKTHQPYWPGDFDHTAVPTSN